MKRSFRATIQETAYLAAHPKYYSINRKFKNFTMIPPYLYATNLAIAEKFKDVDGAVVECGVWRGGMIGGLARLLGNDKEYFLYDSFEGLPQAQQLDGESAKEWQSDTNSSQYFDNCKAEEHFAKEAMELSGVSNYHINKGWFNETLANFDATKKISILRIDGDWYDSTFECLRYLYDKVSEGGVIIMDDYYWWDGSSRAVHDYLSGIKSTDRIHQHNKAVAFIVRSASDREIN